MWKKLMRAHYAYIQCLNASQAHSKIHATYTSHIHDTRRAHKDEQIMLSVHWACHAA